MTGPVLELVGGRYRLIGQLGSGGMGSVWKARDELLDREVALKELVSQRHDIEPEAKRRERAVNEAQMLARVEHPAIVSVHDLIWVGDDPWIVMGYFRGRQLEKMIRDDPPMDVHEVASIGLPVLHGLVAAHGKGVVHRDIKPANILVAADGSVCLVDFGIAKAVGQAGTSGVVLGTLEYLAPERLEGRSAGSVKADLWSFGVTLYQAIERDTPFRSATREATVASILGKDPRDPRRCGPLSEIVLQLLQRDPARRPDAVAVADALKRVLRGGQRVRPLSEMPVADVAAIVSGSATRSGVATLLQMSDTDAARVLDRSDHGVAGELLGGIAAVQPGRAGRILQIIAVDRAGRVFDYISERAAAEILPVMPSGEAVRILRECEPRTAASALAAMTPESAEKLVRAMNQDHAANVLGHAAPSAVASILRLVPAELLLHLLLRLPAQFRALVRRSL